MDPSTPGVDVVSVDTPALSLPIDDWQLLALLTEAEARGVKQRTNLGVIAKAEANIKFWGGDQVDSSKLDERLQFAHTDNVVLEKLENMIKLAASKMPDIYCAPPDKQQFNMEAARDMQEWIRERIDTNTIKRLVKDGLRSMNLNYIGVIKPRWDYARQDFVFELLNPTDLVFCEGARIMQDGFTIDATDIIFQYVEEPTAVVLAKFKKKANALRQAISVTNQGNGTLPSKLRYTEVHFRWFDTSGRMNEGVCWRYANVILDSMKEPYYDYDDTKVNYFDRPRKPYILIGGYLNLGKTVYESTTAFEQGKPINRMINKRRRQITEISDRAVPKLAFAGGVITKETAENMSPSPRQGIILDKVKSLDDIRKAMMVIPAVQPNPILYNDLRDLRDRMDGIFSTGGSSTAADSASASGISKQISRESDMVTSDDITEVVTQRVVSEMAQWAMQFARLFYDDDRPALRTTNEEGDTKFVQLSRQKIETDVQLVVKASTNDKATRRADAIQSLTGKITDPYTFFEDIETPNPKERTKRLLAFVQAQQQGDFSKYLDSVGIDSATNVADQNDAQIDIETLVSGGQPPVRDPSESYVSTFLTYVNNDPSITPEILARIKQHVDGMKQQLQKKAADQQAEQQGAQPGSQPQDPSQAIQGAPGVQPQQAAYQPQVDLATQFGGGQNANANTLQALSQRIQYPTTNATQPGVVN